VAPLRGSWLAPLLAARGAACLAGVVSNPPYIPSARLPGLQPEVGRYEPSLALDGGAGNGTDSLRCIAADAALGTQKLHAAACACEPAPDASRSRCSAAGRRLSGA
jgi:methylase of polypeptide subunit release factors